jgi:deazaflavin-dependent oxidoreductase (nitroreductase family)
MALTEFDKETIAAFRANAGILDGRPPLLLLHHTGARSGEERLAPLAYLPDGDRCIIFASKGGAPNNPGWYHNLIAIPDVTIEVGAETVGVTAVEVTGAERDALYAEQARRWPNFGDYQAKTPRKIPVIALERR